MRIHCSDARPGYRISPPVAPGHQRLRILPQDGDCAYPDLPTYSLKENTPAGGLKSRTATTRRRVRAALPCRCGPRIWGIGRREPSKSLDRCGGRRSGLRYSACTYTWSVSNISQHTRSQLSPPRHRMAAPHHVGDATGEHCRCVIAAEWNTGHAPPPITALFVPIQIPSCTIMHGNHAHSKTR